MVQVVGCPALSSEGNGKIARSWKGLVVLGVLGLGFMFNADEGTALALADQLGTVLAGIYTLYGMGMKVVNRRWSHPEGE